MNKIRELFSDKKVRYGSYSSLVVAVVVAILIIVNLVVDQIPLKWDLTANKLYSISDQTTKVLDGLEEEVKIIALYEPGKQNPAVEEILNRYTTYSKNIKIEHVDPVQNPGFMKQFDKDGESVSQGSLIVQSGDKTKIISRYDLYNYSYQGNAPQVESLAVEQRVTSAIMYVTSEDNPMVYSLQGHGELAVPYELSNQLENENYDLEDLNLVTEDQVPEDADILLIISPKRDLSEDEDKKLREYLENSGRAVFIMDVLNIELPRFEGILKSYGVGLSKAIAVEEDKNHYMNFPLWLVPNMASHDIIQPLKSGDMFTLLPNSQPIEELDIKKRSLEIEALLTTSEAAWGKTDLTDQSMEKSSDDIQGPFNLAMAITDKPDDYEEKPTKLIVIGGSSFLDRQIASEIPGNMNLMLNSMNWLQDKQESISIRPKSLGLKRLRMTKQQSLVMSGIVVIVIPAIVLIMGIVVWSRRRHL